jgi:hypothetical protein
VGIFPGKPDSENLADLIGDEGISGRWQFSDAVATWLQATKRAGVEKGPDYGGGEAAQGTDAKGTKEFKKACWEGPQGEGVRLGAIL